MPRYLSIFFSVLITNAVRLTSDSWSCTFSGRRRKYRSQDNKTDIRHISYDYADDTKMEMSHM